MKKEDNIFVAVYTTAHEVPCIARSGMKLYLRHAFCILKYYYFELFSNLVR
jgi:hypothetical protein